MTDDVQRDLGPMESQSTTLISQFSALTVKIGIIDKTLSEARGGWRTLLLVGGVAGFIGEDLPLLGVRPGGWMRPILASFSQAR